jgi:peptidoglycan hydrolase CwlO-like protein
MISEALRKREDKKRLKAGELSSDGLAGGNNSGVEGSAQKAKSEQEKMERLVKTMEENFKRELVELQRRTAEQEAEIAASKAREAEASEEKRRLQEQMAKAIKEEAEKARQAEELAKKIKSELE